MKKLWLLLAFLPLSAHAALGITPEIDHWLMEGIDGIYRMQFDKAEEAAKKAMELNPEHPHAYLGLAGITWTRYVYESNQSDPALLAPFETRVNEAIAVGQRWLKKHPKDPEGLMCLGAAYGISSRLMVIRREWIRAYLAGRKAVQLTRAAVKYDPTLWDGYLGIGMYDYYTDVYPRFIGVLAKIVLRGNRLRGIEYLKTVAEKGHYSRNNAKILLVEIYTEDEWGARNPEKALEIMRDLRTQFPESAMMHSAEIVALYEAKRCKEAEEESRKYIHLIVTGKYEANEMAKGYVMLGMCLWAEHEEMRALESLRVATNVKYKGRLSRWAVWALVRLGELEDVMRMRPAALKDYKAAMAEPDTWGFYSIAKSRVSRAYRGPAGPIPPP